MAAPLPCDLCQQEAALLLITNTETGDTSTVGVGCLPAWATAVLLGMLDPLELRTMGDKLRTEADQREEQKSGARRGGKRQRQAAPPDAPPDPEEGPPLAPQAAPDDG